jgi:cytochrome c-L
MMSRKFLKVGLVATTCVLGVIGAKAAIQFTNTITGEPLNFDDAPPDGKESKAFKEFIETGINLYNKNPNCLANGEQLFLGACSGCHGHVAEGKIGPGLNDGYWTYPQNATDKGMFETIFGGASGQMGPMYGSVNVDEMLQVMAWVRHLYKDAPEKAEWLEASERANLKPYDGHSPAPKPDPANTPEECKPAG